MTAKPNLKVGDEFTFTYLRDGVPVGMDPGQRGSFDLALSNERVHFVMTTERRVRVINIESPIPPPEEEA